MFLKYYFLGLPADLSEKLGLAEGYFLSGVFMYAGMRMTLPKMRPEVGYYLGSAMASVFYLVNRLAITSIHFFAYGYASLPLVVGAYVMTTREPKNVLLNCFIVALGLSLAFSHATFLATSLLLVSTYQFYRLITSRASRVQDLRRLVTILIMFVALNSYWILPMLVPYFGGFQTIIGHGEIRIISYDDFINLGGKPIAQILSLNQLWLGIYSQDFLLGLWIPLIAVIAIPLSRKWKFEHSKVIPFFGLAFLLSFLLALRDQPVANLLFSLYVSLPFSGLTWAFLRNPQWFLYVIAYSLACLAGVTAILFISRISVGLAPQESDPVVRNPSDLRNPRKRIAKIALGNALIVLVVVGLITPLVIYTGYPLSGNLDRAYEPVQIPTAYRNVSAFLDSQPGLFRVWWLPVSVEGNLEFDWQASQTFTFPTSYLSQQPYLEGTNNLSIKFLVHLYAQELLGNKTRNLGKILAPLGVKFIVLHEDLRKDQTSLYLAGNPYANSELRIAEKVLEEQSDLKLVYREDFWSTNIYNQTRPSKMLVFQNKYSIPYAFAADPLLLVGGIRSMSNLVATPQLNPFEHSIILTENLASPQLRNLLKQSDIIVFGQNKTVDDLALELEDSWYQYPAQYTVRTRPDESWSSMSDGLVFFYVRQFSQNLPVPYALEGDSLYGGVGLLTSAQNSQLSFDTKIENPSTYDVWVRFMRSPIGGDFSVRLDDQPLAEFNTVNGLTYMTWEKAGTLNLTKGNHSLSLKNARGSNLVNVVAMIPSSQALETRQWVADKLRTETMFTLTTGTDNITRLLSFPSNTTAMPDALAVSSPPAKVLSLSMIKAGEYHVQVSASRSYLITLSEVFNSGWVATSTSSTPLPTFGLMNSFYFEKPGNYVITMKYEFNQYYDLGTWPALGTLIGVPLIITRKRILSQGTKAVRKVTDLLR
jgi:hypothetical protein